jgi:hypothetical protein
MVLKSLGPKLQAAPRIAELASSSSRAPRAAGEMQAQRYAVRLGVRYGGGRVDHLILSTRLPTNPGYEKSFKSCVLKKHTTGSLF